MIQVPYVVLKGKDFRGYSTVRGSGAKWDFNSASAEVARSASFLKSTLINTKYTSTVK